MRHLLHIPILILCIASATVSTIARPVCNEPTLAEQDSTVDIVGYFAKNDTLVYWINQSRWQLTPTDTLKIAGTSTKVMLTVADSTETGYTMNYTFLEMLPDSINDSDLASLLTLLTTDIGQQIVGTTISFETDELGTITRFNNLDQIKQQAESLFKQTLSGVLQTDILSELADQGIDMSRMTEMIDSDQLIDGYLEEIKLLFLLHGLSFKEGQTHLHEDATDTAYENDTYITASTDHDDGTYSISTEVVNIIPPAELKSFISQFFESATDSALPESFNEAFDSQIVDNCNYSSYFSADYLPYGWPYRIINQTNVTLNNRSKSTQSLITLASLN